MFGFEDVTTTVLAMLSWVGSGTYFGKFAACITSRWCDRRLICCIMRRCHIDIQHRSRIVDSLDMCY